MSGGSNGVPNGVPNGSPRRSGRLREAPVMRGEHPSLVPPHDPDAERAVIGAMLVSETAVSKVVERLRAEDFYSETHRVIYSAALKVFAAGEPVDRISVADELHEREEYGRVGGREYLFALVESVPTAANAHHYADLVRDKATLRNLLDAGARIQAIAYSEPDDVSEAIDEAEQTLYTAAEAKTTREGEGLTGLNELAISTLAEVQKRHEAGEEAHGILSGLADLDRITTGVRNGDLAVLAARPAMGKSALAVGYCWNAAGVESIPTAVFSLEMDKEQLSQRLLSQIAEVPLARIRSGALEDEQWPHVVRATARMERAPLWIDDDAGTTVPRMRAKLRRLQARLRARGESLGLVVVDYLQLMVSEKKPENRQAEVAEISRALKVLARDLDVSVLALAQLSRAVEMRHDKRPLLSDLRDSGAIEQDADLVMFLYRDEYYNPDTEDRGIAEIIVGKHRNGATGKVRATWLEKQARFASLTWKSPV